MKRKIREMTNKEIKQEISTLNTEAFKKIKSRLTTLQSEIRAREINGFYKV
jgi:hypothetical protein